MMQLKEGECTEFEFEIVKQKSWRRPVDGEQWGRIKPVNMPGKALDYYGSQKVGVWGIPENEEKAKKKKNQKWVMNGDHLMSPVRYMVMSGDPGTHQVNMVMPTCNDTLQHWRLCDSCDPASCTTGTKTLGTNSHLGSVTFEMTILEY